MNDYGQEKWVDLYQAAMLELQHSLMAGRIADARAEILKRVEKLRELPGLHREERQAIEDALSVCARWSRKKFGMPESSSAR